jgi:hypothetical protein
MWTLYGSVHSGCFRQVRSLELVSSVSCSLARYCFVAGCLPAGVSGWCTGCNVRLALFVRRTGKLGVVH